MNLSSYAPEVTFNILARGFHFCFCLAFTVYFAFVKKEKYSFTYFFALCGLMLMTSLTIGTLARYWNIEHLTLEVDSIFDLTIVPAFAAFGYTLLKQSTPWHKVLTWWFVSELPIIICLLVLMLSHDNNKVFIATVYAIILIIFGLIWGLNQMRRYEKFIKDSYSDIDNRSLSWFYFIIAAMICFIIAYFIIGKYFNMQNSLDIQTIYFIATECLIIFMVYYVYKQKDVEDNILDDNAENTKATQDKHASEKSEEDDIIHILAKKLKTEFEEKELYLKNDINIKDLSVILGSNPKYTSLCLNNILGKNFNRYINELRIHKACEIMKENRGISLPELAQAAGFNSKSTFWRIFEVILNDTPSHYRDMLEKNNADVDDNLNADVNDNADDNADSNTNTCADGATLAMPKDGKSILSQREKALCRLIIDGADTKQQCDGMGIQYNSLRVMRSRLRTRLQLPKGENLDHYLRSHNDILS